MDTPHALVRTPDGDEVLLRPGMLIGRMHSAGLRLDHPAISEAHALVSLRSGHLKLLALRGMLALDGIASSEVTLAPDITIQLAHGLALEVLDVLVPPQVLAFRLGEGPPAPLMGSVHSILPDSLEVVPRFLPEAAAYIWSTQEGWLAKVGTCAPVPFGPDVPLTVEGRTLTGVLTSLDTTDQQTTRATGRLHTPLNIVTHYDTVHLHRKGCPTLTLSGNAARIISELIEVGAPVDWNSVALAIWREPVEPYLLRQRWDRSLAKLRAKLRTAGVRLDLLRSDGTGNIELVLLPGDTVSDQS